MDIVLSKDQFSRALSSVQGVLSRKVSMPILSNVCLTAEEGRLEITATDLDLCIRQTLSVESNEDGRATLSGKKLLELVKELPEAKLRLRKRENQWVEISSGKVLYQLAGLAPEDFPLLPHFDEKAMGTVNAAVLSQMLRCTAYAASADEARNNLNGVLLEPKERDGKKMMRAVATDGHRLSLAEKAVEEMGGLDLKQPVILSRKGVSEILRILEGSPEGVRMGVDQNNVILSTPESLVIFRLVDAQFPEYERVIPPQSRARVVAKKESLLASLKRVSLISSDRSRGVRMEPRAGELKLTSSNPDIGEAEETLEVEYDGETFAIGFNSKYIEEAISAIEAERVYLDLTDSLTQVLIRPAEISDFLAVVMPMRI